MSDELKVSIHFLELILSNGGEVTAQGLSELYEVQQGNKKLILEHLKAINSIIGKAIKELEVKWQKEN